MPLEEVALFQGYYSEEKNKTAERTFEIMVRDWLKTLDFLPYGANYYLDWIIFACGSAIAYFLFYGIYLLAMYFTRRFIRKSGAKFHKALFERKLYRRLLYIPNLIVINALVGLLFVGEPETIRLVRKILKICSVLVTSSIFVAVLNAFNDAYNKKGSMKSIVQAGKTIIYIIGSIFIICLLMDVRIEMLLGTLAGASAIMLLIFKDSILGLVAGVQLSVNKMVLPGDWIEMPSADADGNVIEISLVAVKVQNWDNTITTIPAYDMIAKPIKNWRGMSASGVRRIKRSIFIDMTSAQFCTQEMLDKFRKIQYLADYITKKEAELEQHNDTIEGDKDLEVNGRHLTNLGIFRIYLQRYLENHPMLSHDFTLMARQLQPTNLGIPIEIYAFVNTTNWNDYEKVQSDIFDYVISSINYFELRLFQNPSWNDYRNRHK
jgi:miniconductance mechanosensitive channel